jgi:mycothiol synthase
MNSLSTQADVQLRNFKWSDLEALQNLLVATGVHGHRDWPSSMSGLKAELEFPRVQPIRNVVLIKRDELVAGYGIVEPEKNIGRSVIGLATGDFDPVMARNLLDWAINRASEEAPVVHLAVREHETDLADFLEEQGNEWNKGRKYLKLEVASASSLVEAPAVLPDGFTLRTMLGLDEVPELTYLQNETFKEHFGYSPNTEDEIRARLSAPNSSVDDIVMIHDSNEQLVAYCWTESHDQNGSRVGRIGMTGVLPPARKQGLGRAIAEAGFNHLLRENVVAIELDVDSVNAPAIRIYSSLGFTTHSELNWWERTV